MYVADTGNNRVVRLTTSGVFDANWWGSEGSGNGQFSSPYGVAVDASNSYLFVADTGNNRIQAMNVATQAYVAKTGSLGAGTTQFSYPRDVAVYTDVDPTIIHVYVADSGNNRVVEYAFSTASNTFSYEGTVNTTFAQPQKLTADTSGNVFVTDTTNKVYSIDSARSYQAYITVHDSKGAGGVSINGSALYVIEPNTQIGTYNAGTGAYVTSFEDESNKPADVALDQWGNIYLVNQTTQSVQKFNSVFTPLAEWKKSSGSFNDPMGIGVNTGGDVVIADTGNNEVIRYDTNGVLITGIPTPMVTPAGYSSPKDVGFEDTGAVYVSDSNNNRIMKYLSNNTMEWAIGYPTPTWDPAVPTTGPLTPTVTPPTGPYFSGPYGVTVDSQNKIYIADTGYSRIQRFDANGTFEKSWGEYGSADNLAVPQFKKPQGMAIEVVSTSEYWIYVADTDNNRIQRFDQDGTISTRTKWGEIGTSDGQFINPRNVAIDSAKRVYVSEADDPGNPVHNRRIQVFGNAALSAGVTAVETSGTAVTEDGSVYDLYTVRLNTQPSSTVTLTISSSDATQVTTSTSTLTFTQYNWNVPQAVTVIPVHDYIDQATTQQMVLSHTATSSDPNYNSGINSLKNILVTLTDTDTVGVTLSKTGVNVSESGTTDTYTAVLDSKPTASVTIAATSADGNTVISPSTGVFTTTNWNIPQTLTVSSPRDYIQNGDHDSIITHAVSTTDTSGYQTATVASVTAHITDSASDIAGVTISAATPSPTVEGGSSSTYTISLDTKPSSDVTITIAASSSAELTVSPTTLTFTGGASSNYNIAQTVTVTAVNDSIVNDPSSIYKSSYIKYTLASADSNYVYNPALPPQDTLPFSGVYNGADGNNLTLITHEDDDTAGVVFTESDGITEIYEGQTADTYTVALNSKPSSNVVFGLTHDYNLTISKSTLTFTTTNWNMPQTATVSATNDGIYYGTPSATITHTITSSSDPSYPASSTATLSVITHDTDYPGLTITQPNGSVNIVEGGVTDEYYIKLKTQPLDTVTVTIDGQGAATASPSALTFTTANWGANQIATLSAINDWIYQGSRTALIKHIMTSSGDAGYENLVQYLTVNITDDDTTVPGVQILQTGDGTSVTEAGNTDTYTMVLTSKPTANVKIKIVGDNWQATTSASLYTFTPSLWNIPQTVNVRAIDDVGIDGTQTTVFKHIITSTDLHYQLATVENVNVTAQDNDHTGPVSTPSCSSTPPYDRPSLFQADTTQNTTTLYFTPIKDNISYYYIAYGYKPGDIRFGVSFDYGSYDGVIDYTINMLNSGTTYYYKVRGGNGCATGPWSNDIAATTTASGSAATRVYYASPASYAYNTGGSTGGSSESVSGGSVSHPQFTYNLYLGSRGAVVRSLQMYLNGQGFVVAQSGAGSPGNETDYYGPLTAAAVRRFQEAHFAEILSPLGYSSGTGILGPSTRAYINSH
ncbi:hypothetical protein COY90_03865 [Candidatus Roizmanbacteria bacterium CG_4_10_14_0_8_um_filter_39_9]|uniref:Fibronectin type-III domain-containing protein n=1 Tax=Candidatus Roizmanbacteria bacterium CG_4_10_14_0_8_um_filter_39_9 TaxID=1974829 RepID=A0A2M7QD81_9BACT|nr:MAG: hypothetical protein COY90_03865 [Candidatus Roizmanbacteria bacterium CG_4_10_14_0_8_um_filter_39_9]